MEKSGWISIDEQKPDPDQMVLAYQDIKAEKAAMLVLCYHFNHFVGLNDDADPKNPSEAYFGNISHWMPLPKKP